MQENPGQKNEHNKKAAAICAHLIKRNPEAGYVFEFTCSKAFKWSLTLAW